MQPEISIITIVYNGLPFLKECVESVLKQQFQNWELLISDDVSTDGSREYLTALNDPRIKLFAQEKNLGIFGNLNFLFQQAAAPVCQILCQDDYFLSETSLQQVVNYWNTAAPETGFARFNHESVTGKHLLEYQKSSVPALIKAGKADIWFYIFGNLPGNLSNVSLRTSLFAKAGWFDQSLPYAGDFEFWSRAARFVDFGVVDTSVTYIRRHPNVASNYLNKKGELIRQKHIIVERLYNAVQEQYPGNTFFVKLHGTLQYDSLQRDAAIKFYLKGNKNFFKELNGLKSGYAFSSLGKWLLYIISAGGRCGRIFSAKRLLKGV
ncbi:Glycosyl transferase family 2 [Filimonas lacunae]|uniref:Glycosyl transferase family 2 n=1 Tax=Filimonas lacunae TaxID=477680 RepID=A0A173M9R9_9BACT|nr:glycosyltransferase [Filimonas lacunae]BAV04287.1 glycosyl transferase [Filimonas lacunae]SIT30907.1 Glycosyl transferase family 2 [Filimonas lacunae]